MKGQQTKGISRRAMLRGGITMGTGLALGAAGIFRPERAAAAAHPYWMATTSNISRLGLTMFYVSVTYNPGSNPPPAPGFNSAFIYDYNALSGLNTNWYSAGYDIEKWNNTPIAQQQDPWTYGAKFMSYAVNKLGMNCVWAPARDLYYVSGIVKPPLTGESVDAWYERTKLAGIAATMYVCQSEVDEANLTAYTDFVTKNAAIAKAANPNVWVFAELATTQGTATQMINAAKAVWPSQVPGFYLSVADGDYDKMQQVVQALGGP